MSMININYSPDPDLLIFYGESYEDLNLMPTTTKVGEGKYHYGLAPKGSLAEILLENEQKVFMLRTTGWVDITNSRILELLN